MPLTPEAKQRLMEKLKGSAAPKEEPPRSEDEPMDPEERMVEGEDLLMEEDSEMGEGPMGEDEPMGSEEMVEEPEVPMEGEDRGDVGASTYAKRREEERRIAGPSGPIDRMSMRKAAQEAVNGAAQGRR